MKLEWLEYQNHNQLLNKIDQSKIWEYILGHSFKLNEFVLNPLRIDNNIGSCYLTQKDNKIILIDWAAKQFNGLDCIAAYMIKYPKKWTDVCIDLLKIGEIQSSVSYMAIPGLKKSESVIYPFKREWQSRDKNFWTKRDVSKEQLERKETLTFPIKGYLQEKDGSKIESHFHDLAYAYECNGRYKLYFPERKTYRFLGDQKRHDIWFLNRNHSTLLVCKSQKEMLIWENLVNWNLTHIQGESFSPLDTALIYQWEVGHEKIIFNFDNDRVGIQTAKLFSENIMFKESSYFYIDPNTGFKDIDEMYLSWGKEDTLDYLNTIL